MDRNVILRPWVTEDAIVIATGFILFFIADQSFDDSYVGSRKSLRKKKCTEVVIEFLLEKHQIEPPDAPILLI